MPKVPVCLMLFCNLWAGVVQGQSHCYDNLADRENWAACEARERALADEKRRVEEAEDRNRSEAEDLMRGDDRLDDDLESSYQNGSDESVEVILQRQTDLLAELNELQNQNNKSYDNSDELQCYERLADSNNWGACVAAVQRDRQGRELASRRASLERQREILDELERLQKLIRGRK